jgi:hypothetical protein
MVKKHSRLTGSLSITYTTEIKGKVFQFFIVFNVT